MPTFPKSEIAVSGVRDRCVGGSDHDAMTLFAQSNSCGEATDAGSDNDDIEGLLCHSHCFNVYGLRVSIQVTTV
jgi:hypothetical protein